MLRVPNDVVDCLWLKEHLNHPDLIVLDATIPKVTADKKDQKQNDERIPFSRFFDIKKIFSDSEADFPNTMLSAEQFQFKARALGINQTSCLVIYDQLGIYSSPRAWWMFKSVGFQNVAVLNGGLPEWKKMGFEVVDSYDVDYKEGDFIAHENKQSFVDYEFVLNSINNQEHLVLDARSAGRFHSEAPEPRKGVKSGHIPTSLSMPYASLLEGNKLKSTNDIKILFNLSNTQDKPMIFSCGTGITACVLALGATISGHDKIQVYDGSWTEWGSLPNLPIEV